MSKRHGFAPIFIIVIVAIAAVLGGWYYVKKSSGPAPSGATGPQSPASPTSSSVTQQPSQPSAPDVSSWKTYRNEKYWFELKYPQLFTFVDNRLPRISYYHDIVPYELNHFSAAEEKYEKTVGYLGHSVDAVEDCSIIISSYEKFFTPNILENAQSESRVIDGVRSYEVDNYGPATAGYVIYVPIMDRVLVLDFFDCGNPQENNPITYKDQILSTFKFLN